ncbi:MAG: L-serine ammonia-lyase, iron-sulfur-dependent subunit beta [Bacteroidota bacterium]
MAKPKDHKTLLEDATYSFVPASYFKSNDMAEKSSIFDMIGPIMIGPSSSHTAGVAKIGRVARRLLGVQPERVVITFYNSFARTYEGHGSDRAVLAGLLNFPPDDDRLKASFTHAANEGMAYAFKASANASALHPNSIRIEMHHEIRKMEVMGVSRGGGLISIVEIDKFTCNFTAEAYTLVINAQDIHGSVAFISSVIRHENCNIATLTVNRRGKNTDARLVFELDSPVRTLTRDYLESLDWVEEVTYLEPIS